MKYQIEKLFKLLFFSGITIFIISRFIKAFCVPISYDEAFSFLFFSTQSIYGIFSDYSFPNNHILNTLLIKLFTNLFGESEFIIRLPSLIGGLIFCLFIYKLSTIYIKKRNMQFLYLLLLLSNPFLLDFNSVGRGYSIGMAFCFIGLYYMYRYFDNRYFDASRIGRIYIYSLISVSFALSMLAVPTFVNFFVGILVAFFIVYFINYSHRKVEFEISKFTKVLFFIVIPTIILTKFFYIKIDINPSEIPFGVSWKDFINICVNSFLFYGDEVKETIRIATKMVLLFLFFAGLIYNIMKRRKKIIIAYLFLPISLVLVWFQYFVLRINCPYPRSMLYLLPFLYILFFDFSEISMIIGPKNKKYFSFFSYLPIVILLSINFSYMNFSYHFPWKADPIAKKTILSLKKQGLFRVKMSYPWYLGVAMDYYKRRLGVIVDTCNKDLCDFRILEPEEVSSQCLMRKHIYAKHQGFKLIKVNNLTATFGEPFEINENRIYDVAFSFIGEYVMDKDMLNFADGANTWNHDYKNAEFQFYNSTLDFVRATVIFDGNGEEDEIMRILRTLDVNLKHYPVLHMTSKIEDPEVQVFQLIAMLDVDNDMKCDCTLQALVPKTTFYSDWEWDIYEHVKGRYTHLNIDKCNLIGLEIYFHKIWGVDCSYREKTYEFSIRDLYMFNSNDQSRYLFAKSDNMVIIPKININNISLNNGLFNCFLQKDKLDIDIIDGFYLRIFFDKLTVSDQFTEVILDVMLDGKTRKSIVLDNYFYNYPPPEYIDYDLNTILRRKHIYKNAVVERVRIKTSKEILLDKSISLSGCIRKFLFYKKEKISPESMRFYFTLNDMPINFDKKIEYNMKTERGAIVYKFSNNKLRLGVGKYLLKYSLGDNVDLKIGNVIISESIE